MIFTWHCLCLVLFECLGFFLKWANFLSVCVSKGNSKSKQKFWEIWYWNTSFGHWLKIKMVKNRLICRMEMMRVHLYVYGLWIHFNISVLIWSFWIFLHWKATTFSYRRTHFWLLRKSLCCAEYKLKWVIRLPLTERVIHSHSGECECQWHADDDGTTE